MYLFYLFIYLFSLPFCLSATSDVRNDSLTLLLAKAKSDEAKIQILEELGNSYSKHGMDISLGYAQEMIPLIDKLPRNNQAASYYANTAIIFLNCNAYDQSLELLLKALDIFEQTGNQRSIAATKNTMGGVYLRLGKLDKALLYFREGLECAEQLITKGDTTCTPLLQIFYNNIGLIYNELDDKSVLAGSYFEKAIELMKPDDYYNLGQGYNNLANYNRRHGSWEKAFDCAQKSMEYRKKAKDEYGVVRTNITLAGLQYDRKDYISAKKQLQEAEDISVRIKAKLALENIYNLSVDIAEAEKDYPLANKYLKKQLDVQYSLLNDSIMEKITALQMEYVFAKKTAEHELEVQTAHHRSVLMLMLSLTLVVVAILFYFLLRSRGKRIRVEKLVLEADLESKNKELTTNVMYLMKNTELVKDVIMRLIALRPNMKPDNAKVVKDIITELESSMKDDSWNEFETHFNNVHIDFYRKLKEYCQELTPTELKMCAFLRLNMSSKEISSISGITVKSVDVMRGRIRKKLNISNTDVNLINFLSGF